MNDPSRTDVEDFLRRFRRGLAALPVDIREDLVHEVRSHLEERFEQGRLNLAGHFGSPEEYAARFTIEQGLSVAVARGAPLQLIVALIGRVQATAWVVLVVLALALVEITAILLVGIGILEPFSSGHIGLFLQPDGSFGGLGWISDINSMHEVLGYAGMPLFIFGGLLLFWIGHRLLLGIGRHELKQLRHRIRSFSNTV